MKIAHKFTVALLACVMVALGLNGYEVVHTEMAGFEGEVDVHQGVIGRALKPVVLGVWRTEGATRALEILDEANTSMGNVDIRWVWLNKDDESSRVPLEAAQLQRIADGEEVVVVHRTPDGVPRRYTYVPLYLAGQPPAAIEVSQSIQRAGGLRRAAIVRALLSALLIAGASALATSALGRWLIGRPMDRLIEQAQRTGGGDLTYRIDAKQRDEMGALAREMNRMCDRLSEAQDKIAKETEARLQAIEQLRHADRLATVGRLAAGMAHELGTPLNVVSARAKSIATGNAPIDAMRENGRIIGDQVDRIVKIMRQLLDFARKRDLQRTTSDLRAITRRAISFLGPMSKKHNVDVVIENSEEPVRVSMDTAQMEQVVTNLVMNAVHASQEGGEVRIAIGREHAEPPPDDGRPSMTCVRLDVVDDGAGIPPENLTKIFEPFFTTKPIGEGTGLGLSVVYGIVKDHGGWIAVDAAPGKGSRFTVWLPDDESGTATVMTAPRGA
jgi:two-component system, NtrC family, sensor kinase